jgi:hypothetical protein
VTVVENESKGGYASHVHINYHRTDPLDLLLVDPIVANPAERATKLRSQQEVSTIQMQI